MKAHQIAILLLINAGLCGAQVGIPGLEPPGLTKPKMPANPNLELIEQALQARNVAAALQACSRFSHKEPTFRAQVTEVSRQISLAYANVARAQQAMPPTKAEAERQRRNASMIDRPNKLFPNDTSNQRRAEEMRAKADAMVEAASKQVENATAAAESRVAALSELITRIRESDAEEIRKKDEETRKKAEAMAEETRKKAEAMAEVTTKKGEAMAEKQFLEKISEPNGKPEFTSKATSPSYAETLDFINGKLSEAGWSMKYGTNSKKFIIIHSSGAYFVDFATLSAGIKYTTVGAFFKVTLEAAGARNPIQNIAMNGQAEDAVTSIDVPCKDKFDSEKLAKAFRHLILMAGGKDDPF